MSAPAVAWQHPSWCAGDCRAANYPTGAVEIVHQRETFAIDLRQPNNVVDTEQAASPWPPPRPRRAEVVLMRFDNYGPDAYGPGTRPGAGAGDDEVVLDVTAGVTSLTPAEAARLGAALLRAAALARVGAPAGGGRRG